MTCPELCPKCGNASRIAEVRKDGKFNGQRWRKRRFLAPRCWEQWFTVEVIVDAEENNQEPASAGGD